MIGVQRAVSERSCQPDCITLSSDERVALLSLHILLAELLRTRDCVDIAAEFWEFNNISALIRTLDCRLIRERRLMHRLLVNKQV